MRRTYLLILAVFTFPLIARAAAPHDRISTEVSAIERTTQQIRQLNERRPVKAYFLADSPFDSAVRAETALENPETEIQISQRELILLGLLPRGSNLHAIIYQNLTGNILGFYDPHRSALYVRNDANQVFGPQRYAIAHEYTHALQDQYYHLLKLQPDESKVTYRNSDLVTAHHALTEGDAVLTQTLFINRTYSASDLNALIALQSRLRTPSLPPAIDREFNFAYADRGGGGFVAKLYRTGGIAAVSGAYQHLPRSTYEIMFPASYLQGWKPASVTLHAAQGFSAWKQVDDDVFGAFGYHLLLWQFLRKPVADRVAHGYRGDRYIFLENGSEDAMLFKSQWIDFSAAKLAEDRFVAALKVRLPNAKIERGSGTTVSGANVAVFLTLDHANLTMAYAPTPDLARQLGTAATS
jgi:hypothetical protein